MEYSPQNLEYAVSVFYNGEQTERARAHQWLTAAQRPGGLEIRLGFFNQTRAPKFSSSRPRPSTPRSCDAGTSCLGKLRRVKEKLLQAVHTYAKGPKIVTNRLCISLAAFILQQGTQDLATILRPLSNPDYSSLLLEVLTVIPEEFNSMTMGSSLRARNRTALQNASPMVLDDMLRYLNTVYNDYSKEPPSEAIIQTWVTASTCATSWLSLGGEDGDGGALPDRLPLCRALLRVIPVLAAWNEAVSDSALDACEASLITCMVCIVECHSRTVVSAVERPEPHEGARQLIELLLQSQAAPGHYPLHETRSNLVFGAWYTLQDEVLNVMESSRKIHPVWRAVFSRLLTALVAKSEANESALCRDDRELLRCYRQDVADTVMYCYGMLGDWCWSTVEAAFTAADTEVRREAALHIFLALADAAPHKRAPEPLVAMLQHAVTLAREASDKRTLNTALDCLGGYAAWLSSVGGAGGAASTACEARGAALGEQMIMAAGAALQRCPAVAAHALRRLCADCSAPAASLAPEIVQAALSEVGRSDTWVRRQLLGAAGAALSATDPDTARPLLEQLAAMLEQHLREQALEPARLTGAAECAAALLAALAPQPQLAAVLFRALLPTLPPFAQHQELIEPLFSVLKHTISTLMDECLPAINDIAHLTIAAFHCRPTAAGLDVVKLLILILGNSWPEAGRLLNACVACAARALAADPGAASDLAEGLFTLLHAITKKRPQYCDWLDDQLPTLVELGCECVRLWEAGAARAACAWLSALCAQRPLALQPSAPALTAAALRCIGGATPRNQIEPLAELLLALNRASWRQDAAAGAGAGGVGLALWLRQALEPRGFPTVHATEPTKHKFIAAVSKEKSSKRRILETVQEFSLVCRGLIGTEYARQTLASKQLVA
ncbi:importin-13 [Phthorimaea operculella]|nr:importin-13 [Phthorimaea operculella]